MAQGMAGDSDDDTSLGWAPLLREFFAAHPWMLTFNVFYLLAVPIAEIAMPHLYGRLVAVMQRRRSSAAWAADVKHIFILIVVALILTRAIFYFAELLDAKFTTILHAFIRDRAMGRLLSVVEMQPEGSVQVGKVVSKFIKLPWAMEHIINTWRGTVVPRLVVFLSAATYMALMYDSLLGALLLALGALYVSLIVYVPLHCCDISIARDRLYNLIMDDVDDILRNAVSVYSQGQETAERARVSRRGQAYTKAYMCMVRCWLPSYGLVTVITVVFLSAFLWRTFMLASHGRISGAALVPIAIIMMYFITAFGSVPSIIRPLTMNYGTSIESSSVLDDPNAAAARASSDREGRRNVEVDALVAREQVHADAAAETAACGDDQPSPTAVGVRVEFRDVTYRYPGAQHDALHGFSAVFEPGMTTVVWGPIGSGKSTMLKLLLKQAAPTSGEILVDGTPLSSLPARRLRRVLGYVPQQATLFDRSIVENVLYGNTPCKGVPDAERVLTALGLMGPDGFGRGRGGASAVRGLDTPVGKGGSALSGGQRQAVLLARALLKEPAFLLLDEPTSSMDTESKELMRRILVSPAPDGLRGKTVIIVTHDEFLLDKVADRVIRM